MDIDRLHRALQARRIEAVEGQRKRFLEGKLRSKDLTAQEWKMILEHDALVSREK